MYKMPSQTQRITSAIAERSRAIRRSRYLSKRRKVNPIMKQVYGKSDVQTLSYSWGATTGGTGSYVDVYGLNYLCQQSNDWTAFSANYSLFNIVKVEMFFYPACIDTGSSHILIACYDPLSATALLGINTGLDHQVSRFLPTGRGAFGKSYNLKFNPRCIGTVPLRTTDTTEAWGWLKFFTQDSNTTHIGSFHVILTVAFSTPQ